MKPKKLNLYHVSQKHNTEYDTYSDFIIACENEEEAKHTHPSEHYKWEGTQWVGTRTDGSKYEEGNYSSWTSPDRTTVKLIGKCAEGIVKGIICKSFHAG